MKTFKQGGTVMIGYYLIYSGLHFVVNLDYMFVVLKDRFSLR